MYDDITIRELINLHKPYGKIEFYVDHFTLDNAFDVTQKTDKHQECKEPNNGEKAEDDIDENNDNEDFDYDVDETD